MKDEPVAARARYRLLAWIAGGVLLVVLGWFVFRSARDDQSATAKGTGSSTGQSADPASSVAHRGPTRRAAPSSGPVAPAVEEQDDTSIAIPVPDRLGGGKPVSASTEELADRMRLLPGDLADLAEEPGGDLPPTIVRAIEDAHAQGTALGEQLGLDPSQGQLLAGRFTNQLVRLEREVQQSPHATYDDVLEMVTRDTLEDLRRNLGDDVAQAAESEVRGLKPLRSH